MCCAGGAVGSERWLLGTREMLQALLPLLAQSMAWKWFGQQQGEGSPSVANFELGRGDAAGQHLLVLPGLRGAVALGPGRVCAGCKLWQTMGRQ